ncbi:MAG: sigma-70 family RNA polymerase sigma factor [Prevotella sp.]|nr:sigma-70 family RNA polymerase sigma factor [Prevotella sp.]
MTTETFKQEAQRMRPALVSLALGILKDSDEAEDVVQDVLLRLWQMREQLRMPITALAKVLTRNRCIDQIRRRRPTEGLTVVAVEEEDEAKTELIERMMRVIETLPDMQQTILCLRHVNGMEIKEIAELTGSTEVAVRKALSRARQAVRDKFN